MIDFDALFDRHQVSHLPVTLIVRYIPKTRVLATTNRAIELLDQLHGVDRFHTGDEIVLLADRSAPSHLPARINGVRVRVLTSEHPDSGEMLSSAIRDSQNSVIVLLDSGLTLQPDEFRELLNRLDHADIVTTCRPGRSHKLMKSVLSVTAGLLAGWLGFLYWQAPLTGFFVGFLGALGVLNMGPIFRRSFGIPVSDPVCPIKAFRKEAADGIPLQCDAFAAEMELVAKLTFLTTLVDELPIEHADAPATTFDAARGQWVKVLRVLFRPSFWRFDPDSPHYRPALNTLTYQRRRVPAKPVHLRRQMQPKTWGPQYPKHQLPASLQTHRLRRLV